MTKFIKYFSIMICVFVLVGCGNEENEKNKELPTDIANNIELDTKGSSAVCTAEYDYSDTDGFVTGSKMVIYADENGIVTKIVTQEKVFSYDESILETLKEGIERNYSASSQYGGYQYEVVIDGNELTSNATLDYTKMDLKSMANDIEDLKVGMELQGTVRNVASFGAFIDIGLHDDGLVHISKMSKSFVKNPNDIVHVGDIVTCYVADIDLTKQKVQLSLIKNS